MVSTHMTLAGPHLFSLACAKPLTPPIASPPPNRLASRANAPGLEQSPLLLQTSRPTTPSQTLSSKLPPLSDLRPSSKLRPSTELRSLTRPPSLQEASSEFFLSDKQFEERGLRLRTDHQGIDLDQLNNLFGRVGFPRRLKTRLAFALENTPHLLWIEDVKDSSSSSSSSGGGGVVGFARATGDQVFNAIIWDVVVDPKLQGTGLGKALMDRMLVLLLEQGICNIGLFAESQVVQFYKPLGFMADPDGISCMALRRKSK